MKLFPIIIALVGVILLSGAAATYVSKASSTTVCEACGMEIPKDDTSTITIASDSAGDTHYACCPVCAMVVSIYYENATLKAQCFSCGENITITFAAQNITSVNPTDDNHNVTMIFAMACEKNKFVCTNTCAGNIKTTFEWARDLPMKTVPQTYSIALSKLATFTVGYKPVQVPTITYLLAGAGAVLLVTSPLEWALVERRKKAV